MVGDLEVVLRLAGRWNGLFSERELPRSLSVAFSRSSCTFFRTGNGAQAFQRSRQFQPCGSVANKLPQSPVAPLRSRQAKTFLSGLGSHSELKRFVKRKDCSSLSNAQTISSALRQYSSSPSSYTR